MCACTCACARVHVRVCVCAHTRRVISEYFGESINAFSPFWNVLTHSESEKSEKNKFIHQTTCGYYNSSAYEVDSLHEHACFPLLLQHLMNGVIWVHVTVCAMCVCVCVCVLLPVNMLVNLPALAKICSDGSAPYYTKIRNTIKKEENKNKTNKRRRK